MKLFLHRLRSLLDGGQKEDDLRRELEFHLAEESEARQVEGVTAEAARAAARRDLGSMALVQEETRAVWTFPCLEQLAQDCRYGLRTLAGSKTFSLLAILSLGLGLGASTAIYSFMDWLLMRSLPVADPGSLAVLNWREPAGSGGDSVVSGMSGNVWRGEGSGRMSGIFPFAAFELIRQNSDALFSSVFAYYPTGRVNVMVRGQAEVARGEFVSGDYFRGLAVAPAAGRLVIPDDDRVGAPAVAVLSFAYSQRRFGDAARAPGQPIFINHVPFLVAGVAPPEFFGVDPAASPDFYVPLRANLLLNLRSGPNVDLYHNRNFYWLEMMARLHPGVSTTQAQAALSPLFRRWVESTARNDRERAKLPELRIREGAAGLDTLRRRYSKPLFVLLGMAALVLVIVCVNIANLLLARAASRRREIAIRLSIGASRARVIRQLLTESILLSAIGCAVAIPLALWGIRVLTALLANGADEFTIRPGVNWQIFLVSFGLAVLTGLLFGLAPALQATRVDVAGALKETRAGQPRTRARGLHPGQALVAAQIGISLVMLMAAGLFVRTLLNLQSIQLGFNGEDILLFRMNARQAGHRDPEIITFYSDLQERFRAIAGVRSATAMHHPLIGQGTSSAPVVPAGEPGKPRFIPHVLMTGADFFSTMQVPVLLGRGFDSRDRAGSPPVAIVNEAYVKSHFRDRNPIGEHLTVRLAPPLENQEVVVIGVVRNARYGALKGEFSDIVYLPFHQNSYYPLEELTFALRSSGNPLRHLNAVREVARQADPRVPVTDVQTQAAQIDQTMTQEILFAHLCTAFAVLTLLIACIGLYGTMAHLVERRTGEIGIRMALGADRGDIVGMVLRQSFLLTGAGLTLGVPFCLIASRLVASFLFGVEPNDAVAVCLSVVILVTSVLLAGYVPARRASRVDPMTAVRSE